MIYFVQAGKGGKIKIGYTDEESLFNRISTLQTGSPEKLVLLLAIPGNTTVERQIHKRFADCRLHGEWFEATTELMEYISSFSPKTIKAFEDLQKQTEKLKLHLSVDVIKAVAETVYDRKVADVKIRALLVGSADEKGPPETRSLTGLT
jgi:hypothetical protein